MIQAMQALQPAAAPGGKVAREVLGPLLKMIHVDFIAAADILQPYAPGLDAKEIHNLRMGKPPIFEIDLEQGRTLLLNPFSVVRLGVLAQTGLAGAPPQIRRDIVKLLDDRTILYAALGPENPTSPKAPPWPAILFLRRAKAGAPVEIGISGAKEANERPGLALNLSIVAIDVFAQALDRAQDRIADEKTTKH